MSKLRIETVEPIYAGWIKLCRLVMRDAKGDVVRREVVDHGRAAAVLPYDPVRRTALLVRLPRAPVIFAEGGPDLLEAPAGMQDEDDPEACARREAMEEVGVRLGELERVAAVWTSPGVLAERMSLFLAAYAEADRTGAGGGVEGEQENITVLELPLAALWRMTEAGEIHDLKSLALIYALRVRHPGLFEA